MIKRATIRSFCLTASGRYANGLSIPEGSLTEALRKRAQLNEIKSGENSL
jgi:hypothetical protein